MTQRRVNILLVDDRDENLLALEEVLAPLGHNLVRASSGEEALKHVLRDDFALVLMDVQMPRLDGFETAAYIKQREKTRNIPIIFLTAISKDMTHVFKGYSAGAVDYVFKPFDPAVLRSKVSVFVELHIKSLALQESEERFRRAFDGAPGGVALLRDTGRFLQVNTSFCSIMGRAHEDLLGMSVHELVDPLDAEVLKSCLTSVTIGEAATSSFEIRFRPAGSHLVWGLVSVSPIADGSGETTVIFQFNDVTERKELEMFRDRFIESAAHELRTPLTTVSGLASLLADRWEQLGKEQVREVVVALDRQGKRLKTMVNSLLDLARLKDGRVEVDLRPMDPSVVVRQVVDVTPPPEGKTVEVDLEEELSALCDPSRLDQIVTNLLINAYRYGGSKVSLATYGEDGHVILKVSDDGDGVPSELVAHMFEPFARGVGSDAIGGSGLGLALVQSLTHACGGDISYQQEEPRGAAFVVRLPAAG